MYKGLTVGEKLTDLRKERKMTQNDVAKISGLSTPTISNYENDKGPVKAESLAKLLQTYEITTEEFFGPDWLDYEKDMETFKQYGFSENFFREFVLWEKYGGHHITKCLNLLFEPPLSAFTFFENLERALEPANHEKLASLSSEFSHDASMRFLLEPVIQSLIMMFEAKHPEFTHKNTL